MCATRVPSRSGERRGGGETREEREIERDGEKLPERRVEGRRPRATNSASSRAPRPTFLPALESENASFSIPSYMNSDPCVTLEMFPRAR